MKKIKYLLICLLIIICSGCVKYNVKMGINPDKSMELEIIYAVEKSLVSNGLDKTEISKLEKEGYKLKEYNKDSYTGYKLTKKIKNIDEISTVNDNDAELDITKESKYMFKIKKGIFKNEYTYIGNKVQQVDSYNTESTDSKTLESYGMEMNLTVSLPYKVKKSNATETSKDGKELKWNLLTMKERKIFFMFDLYNIPNIVVSAIGLLAIIVIIIFISKGKKKKDQYDGNFDIPNKPIN